MLLQVSANKIIDTDKIESIVADFTKYNVTMDSGQLIQLNADEGARLLSELAISTGD